MEGFVLEASSLPIVEGHTLTLAPEASLGIMTLWRVQPLGPGGEERGGGQGEAHSVMVKSLGFGIRQIRVQLACGVTLGKSLYHPEDRRLI